MSIKLTTYKIGTRYLTCRAVFNTTIPAKVVATSEVTQFWAGKAASKTNSTVTFY